MTEHSREARLAARLRHPSIAAGTVTYTGTYVNNGGLADLGHGYYFCVVATGLLFAVGCVAAIIRVTRLSRMARQR